MELIASTATPPTRGCKAKGCGTNDDGLAGLPASVREQVQNHPCFSEKAHHHFARMHVAVAPACNIQCHYCNRKYDCSNESRPGVVSEVLTPDQAIRKVKAVAAAIPQMTVLGIAGPGDPLANPERTFETFRRLSEETPDIKLCVSTNGLRLPEFADEIARYNIQHVTITINCLDPEIGARIYPWIFWNHRRIRGVKAAKILIRNQLKGLEMLVERGVLVKVNSVMIPGVNDHHLAEVSRAVKERGAFLHNVMPLIAEAEHGTFYGVTGQRAPSNAELHALQESCSDSMSMMRHCRQCRADAVGMLGEDRGQEFTLDKIASQEIDYPTAMARRQRVQRAILDSLAEATPPLAAKPPPEALIAVASKGGQVVDEHFGHARHFSIYRVSAGRRAFVERRAVALYCSGASDCPEEEERLEGHLGALADCNGVLCSRIGIGPWQQLERAGIEPSSSYALEPIDQALDRFYQDLLEQGKLTTSHPQQATA
ncbi:nitrogenase cofactor biosynthesis protein NifB [Aestuariirhabdus litorea]|uniref:FeMo cofactor biosynthesis protein NifB n=1 Tax=Aestuariirhabdus litorea TaxID=2528527 RepID=A0A3P3VKR5_9GAMM|nr:nitrogenase cofactor biosynthesis protein NifB [Aestuariirhabdus litorea]RRJ82897.1 nitrogenase cofactor biosynthesis protein NifB [Aestuariirhabdus litorea]RWW93056.1 nitrogenase cofactor biosynthesis protein NifB [Endozoicomonadaceae bacterium GTF-13]